MPAGQDRGAVATSRSTSARSAHGAGHDGNAPRQIAEPREIFPAEDRAFTDAIQTGDWFRMLCDDVDGYRAAALTLAANEAMESRSVITLPW